MPSCERINRDETNSSFKYYTRGYRYKKVMPEPIPAGAVPEVDTKTVTLGQEVGLPNHKSSDDEEKEERKWGEIKKENKEMKQAIVELTTLVKAGETSKMTEKQLADFAEKRGVDPESVRELADILKLTLGLEAKPTTTVQKSDDEDEPVVPKTSEKISPRRLETAVSKMLNDFLDTEPEYAEIVDEDVIKDMVLANPEKYQNQTMAQIVEKVYGRALKGKTGIESPRTTSKETTKRRNVPVKDQKEFEEILKDPEKLSEYKTGLMDRIKKYTQ